MIIRVARAHPRERLVRRALLADAAGSAALGLTLLAASISSGDPEPFGLPRPLALTLAAALVPWIAGLVTLATCTRPSRPGVWVVVALNLLWTDLSIALAAGAWWPLTPADQAVAVIQAVAVLGLAVAEAAGVRRLVTPSPTLAA